MRLTLRTLLAYLDDTLEPTQARLIGQKVAESEAAQELIGRIKQVTRRRRLTTPPVSGPGAKFDPNTIAEYLDNVLPGEQVAELEETCLASDVHLAEVAACHQVLTLFLGEPALVPPTARQRMYGLIRGREAIPRRKAAASGAAAGAPSGRRSPTDDEETLFALPFFRRGDHSIRWPTVAVAACLLLGAVVTVWMAVASSMHSDIARPRGTPEEPPVQTASADLSKTPQQKAQPETPTPPVEAKNEPTPAPQSETPAESGAAAGTGKEDAAQTASPTVPKPKTDSQTPQSVPEASTERAEIGRTNLGQPTVLLQRPLDKPAWQRLKPNQRLFTNEYLVSLPGYRSELRTDSGVQLMLWGNLPEFSRLLPPRLESAVILHANRDMDLDFTLDRGRVVLSNHKREGPARIRLRFRDEAWDLTLPDQSTEVAAELVGICLPYNREPGGGDPELHLALLGLKGQAQVKIRYEQHLLPSPSMLTWDNIVGAARSPVSLPRAPDWWTNPVPLKTPMQAPLEELTKRLAFKNADVAIAEAKNSPDPPSRVLAMRCLGAMDNYSSLLDGLADDKHPDARFVAIEELRHLLGLSAQNDAKLRAALKQKNYSEGQAQTILQLLHGISLEQWANPTIRTTALEYLLHDKLAIRQLTHTLLMALEPDTGRKIPYDPAGDNESRTRGYEAWRKALLTTKPRTPGTP